MKKFLLLAMAAFALTACGTEDDVDTGESTVDIGEVGTSKQALTRPACTAANEGQSFETRVRRGNVTEVVTHVCNSGGWELFSRCIGGTCVFY